MGVWGEVYEREKKKWIKNKIVIRRENNNPGCYCLSEGGDDYQYPPSIFPYKYQTNWEITKSWQVKD